MRTIVIFHYKDNRLRQPVSSTGEMCVNDVSITGRGRRDVLRMNPGILILGAYLPFRANTFK